LMRLRRRRRPAPCRYEQALLAEVSARRRSTLAMPFVAEGGLDHGLCLGIEFGRRRAGGAAGQLARRPVRGPASGCGRLLSWCGPLPQRLIGGRDRLPRRWRSTPM
jgi:hypothetical protein